MAVKEDRGPFGNIIIGRSIVRAFKDEDIQFLAPLLVEGLARAASDQQVGFRVVQPGMLESTRGSLYAYGQSLYLTVPWLTPRPETELAGRHYHPRFSLSRSRQNGRTRIATRARPK